MFTLKTITRKINDREVKTWRREVNVGDEKLIVEAGRTQMGDKPGREGGARLYLSMMCREGDFFFRPVINRMGQFCGFEMACCGNDAAKASLDSLFFATDALLNFFQEEEMRKDPDKRRSTMEDEDPDDSQVLHCDDLDEFPEDAHCCPKCPKWDTCDRRKE